MKKLKGFTLVELIVVMLILAILAGMFIPSMIGYIDKANESEIQMQTRQLYQAAQVISTENYKNGGFSCSSVDLSSAATDNDKKIRELAKLSEINSGTVSVELMTAAKLQGLFIQMQEKPVHLLRLNGILKYPEPLSIP